MSIFAIIESKQGTRDVEGEGLWQLNLFASRTGDGSGDRSGLKRQILEEPAASQPLAGGIPLNLLDIKTSFDLGSVGCTDYGFICLEFQKGRIPRPQFYMFTEAGTPTLITCHQRTCQAGKINIILSFMYCHKHETQNQLHFLHKNFPANLYAILRCSFFKKLFSQN